jgi:hypothetical protein
VRSTEHKAPRYAVFSTPLLPHPSWAQIAHCSYITKCILFRHILISAVCFIHNALANTAVLVHLQCSNTNLGYQRTVRDRKTSAAAPTIAFRFITFPFNGLTTNKHFRHSPNATADAILPHVLFIHSFIPQCLVLQLCSLFQSKLFTLCNLVLTVSISSTLSFP